MQRLTPGFLGDYFDINTKILRMTPVLGTHRRPRSRNSALLGSEEMNLTDILTCRRSFASGMAAAPGRFQLAWRVHVRTVPRPGRRDRYGQRTLQGLTPFGARRPLLG